MIVNKSMRASLLGLILSLQNEYVYSQKDIFQKAGHLFYYVEIDYRKNGCSFQYSPVDFCDARHASIFTHALQNIQPNFFGHYILLAVPEWDEASRQRSLVAIDSSTGAVIPVPIDAFSGTVDKHGVAKNWGRLRYGLASNEVCIQGAIFVYRATENGTFCFALEGNKFVGHHTTYMDGDPSLP